MIRDSTRRHGPDSAWPVLDAGHNLRYFLPWDYWGGMQLKAKLIVVALSSALFAVSVVAHPASGDSSKDRLRQDSRDRRLRLRVQRRETYVA